jgi:hypothetical protein
MPRVRGVLIVRAGRAKITTPSAANQAAYFLPPVTMAKAGEGLSMALLAAAFGRRNE